jgi:hypothetical protein
MCIGHKYNELSTLEQTVETAASSVQKIHVKRFVLSVKEAFL